MDYLTACGAILGQKSQDVRPLQDADRGQPRLAAAEVARLPLRPPRHRRGDVRRRQPGHLAGRDARQLPEPVAAEERPARRSAGRSASTTAPSDERFREGDPLGVLDGSTPSPRQPGPKFVVFHTLLPHDPYIFGAQRPVGDVPEPLGRGHPLAARACRTTCPSCGTSRRQAARDGRRDPRALEAAARDRPPVRRGLRGRPTTFGESATQRHPRQGPARLLAPGRAPGARARSRRTRSTRCGCVFNQVFGTHYPMLPTASYPERRLPVSVEEARSRRREVEDAGAGARAPRCGGRRTPRRRQRSKVARS